MSKPRISNMSSKQYCPKCGSFSIWKIRRGFIKKYMLNSSPQYKCKECGEQVSEAEFSANETKSMPAFAGSEHSS